MAERPSRLRRRPFRGDRASTLGRRGPARSRRHAARARWRWRDSPMTAFTRHSAVGADRLRRCGSPRASPSAQTCSRAASAAANSPACRRFQAQPPMRHRQPPALARALEQDHGLPAMGDALERASEDVALAGQHHVGLAHGGLVAGPRRFLQGAPGRGHRALVVPERALQVGEPEQVAGRSARRRPGARPGRSARRGACGPRACGRGASACLTARRRDPASGDRGSRPDSRSTYFLASPKIRSASSRA